MADPRIFDFIRRRIGEGIYSRLATYDDAVNYIGPGKRGALKILRYTCGCDLNPAGWLHDCGYEFGGGEKEKEFWDDLFLAAMLKLIELHQFPFGTAWLLRRAARFRAIEYYNEVRECGDAFFIKRDKPLVALPLDSLAA